MINWKGFELEAGACYLDVDEDFVIFVGINSDNEAAFISRDEFVTSGLSIDYLVRELKSGFAAVGWECVLDINTVAGIRKVSIAEVIKRKMLPVVGKLYRVWDVYSDVEDGYKARVFTCFDGNDRFIDTRGVYWQHWEKIDADLINYGE